MRTRFFFFLCLIHASTLAQDQPILKLSQWHGLQVLDPYVTMYVDSANTETFDSIGLRPFFSPPKDYLEEVIGYPSSRYIHYFRIRVLNDLPDTATYFFMASPQKKFEVMAIDTNRSLRNLAASFHQQAHIDKTKIYRYDFTPREQMDFIIKLTFPHHARAVAILYMEPMTNLYTFFHFLKGVYYVPWTFTWFFCGMLLMMFLYILLKFVQIRSREYFYYAAYIFFFLLFFVMRVLGGSGNESILYGEWFSGIANDQLQACAYIMYYFFVKHFLSTKKNLPKLHLVLNFATVFLLVYMLVDFTLFWFPELMQIKFRIWDTVRLILLCVTIYSIGQLIKLKSPLGNYVIWGGLLLSVLGLLAMLFSFYPQSIHALPYPFNSALTYFELGIAAELICFSLGLGYKNRLVEVEKMRAEQDLKIQTERQEFERYRAMATAREGERSRIAKDLHDGVGGLLTGVKISLANMHSKLSLPPEDELVFARSLDMLDGSVQELRRVAHSLKPPSLEMFGLKTALRDFVESVNSMKTVKLVFQVIGEEKTLSSERELIVYRMVQELINNVLKHAQANSCLVQLAFLNEHLSLTVEDDGKGFNPQGELTGMGLTNLKQRIDFMKGTLDLNSAEGEGTSVQISIPYLPSEALA